MTFARTPTPARGAALTDAMTSLVRDLDRAVRSTAGDDAATVAAVAEAVRGHVAAPRLLRPEQRTADRSSYRQHVLHVAPDGAFSVVGLVWLPGQETPIHDHLAWCVVGVHEGLEHETRYTATPGGRLDRSGTATAFAGDVSVLLPPGDIHRVRNTGDALAVSIHVYGADLRRSATSIRRVYADDLVRRTPVGS